MKKGKRIWLPIFVLLIFTNCTYYNELATNIQVPILFSDNMVLQRNQILPVWGTADVGGKVKVEINNQSKTTVVRKDGKWRVTLDKMSAGGPYELKISGKDSILIKNVMIGEVWVCSGQSNMQMPLADWGKIVNYEKEIASANYPNIRLFYVNRTMSNVPVDTISSSGWDECNPNTIAGFSATAYFFGRHLFENLKVPVGLIHTSWGGSVAEAWASENALETFPEFVDEVNSIKMDTTHPDTALKEYKINLKKYQELLVEKDAGYRNNQNVWKNPNLDVSDWDKMNLPTFWEKAGHEKLDGAVWFRKEVNIPASMVGKELTLQLGPINDRDITWFNGVEVGRTSGASKPRIYKIPVSLVKSGKNVIVVRVFDIGANGGIWGKPEQVQIKDNFNNNISLAGFWSYNIGLDLKTMPPQPVSPQDINRPTVLHNAMISPLIPFGIRGAIWYQGESNANRAFQYRTLFPAVIKDWRALWNQGDFPFLFVQLANFQKVETKPKEDTWAELREAQLLTLSLPNTGMAVCIDIGDAEDIHPKNKQEVGRRLALNALNLVYGQDVVYSGPMYKSMQVEGDKIRLSFDLFDGGLTTKEGDKLTGFSIAGSDKKFHWADAEIDGKTILVSCKDVPVPVAVRYAWASNPICNLYNGAGLPASPFRTDSWKGITEGNR